MKASIFRFITLSAAILFTFLVIAQEEINPRETFVEAESYFLFEEYRDALPLYQKLLRIEPENYNLMYKIGICYLNDPYQKEKSVRYLLDASKHINREYKSNSFKEKMAPPEVNYYLGQAYRINGQFDKALEYYSIFKKELDPVIFDIEVVNDEIASCQVAREMLPSPIYLTQSNAGTQLNSRFADFNAVLSGDGKTIIFTRELQFYTGVFISQKDNNGNWSAPYNLTPDFGLDGNSVATGISYNGDEVFVYRSDNFDGNIYSSKLVNGKWQTLKKLNENINTKYWESHASPSPDGKYLFFTSNRKDGYGGLDIYKAPRISGGDWGTPINLGPIVNSKYNEEAPFVSPDNYKLFFSSLGHNGMGGYDIFVSEMVGPSSWSRPVNMGYPLNTPDDDLFFCPAADDNFTGILSAYDENSTNGLLDIYWVKVYNSVFPREFKISGKIDVPTANLLKDENINVSIIDSKQGKIVEQVTVNASGEFNLGVSQGNYQLLVDGKGIKPVSIPLALSVTQKDSEIDLPLIETQIAAAGEDVLIASQKETPKLEIQGEKYIITEESPIKIKLNAEAGNKLEIQNYVNGKPEPKEEIIVSKDKFTYTFSPKPGDNRLVFTIYDKNGNVNQQEITVYFKAPEETVPLTSQEVTPAQANLAEIATLAEGELQKYLKSLDSLEYSSLVDLYNQLIANAAQNGYTQEQVDELITLLLSQRNKDEFVSETRSVEKLKLLYSNDTLIESASLPIVIVQKTKQIYSTDGELINEGLVDVIPFEGTNDEKLRYILSFTDTDPKTVQSESTSNVFSGLKTAIGGENATRGIELSSTTENLDKFYYSLIASAEDDLRKLLLELNFDSLQIMNSIDLVEYLFKLADEGKLSKIEIIKSIENSKKSGDNNIEKFRESLANAASGGLKVHIQEMDVSKLTGNAYLEIIETLLRDAQAKGYNKSEVYDLLLKLIGIDNVEDFITAMRKYTNGDLDSLLSTIDISKFSKPLEIIQYLLSEAAYYDFSDSDFNELLLRMLLEKGIGGLDTGKDSEYTRELIKQRRFVTSIVLANILLLVFIILFWRRKKKKDNN